MSVLKQYLSRVNFGNALCVLLFMYPMFATVVRHWNSGLFALTMILGLVYFFSQRRKDGIRLHRYEKVFLWLLAGNFFVFILTSVINLPEKIADIRFDIELRFLLIIPLYFLLIKSGHGFKCLVYGAILSVFIALGYCLYYVVYLGQHEFAGIYSHLYTGPIILIYATISLGYLFGRAGKKDWRIWSLILAVIVAAGFSIATTHARVAYIGVLAVAILFAGLYSRNWWKVVSVVLILGISLAMAFMAPQVKSRMMLAYQELTDYLALSTKDARISATINSSVGTRLEMWRIAPLVLRDHTLFGVGNGNYNEALQVYVDNKELNRAVIDHSHAHNVFVNVLIVKGLLGLMITCLVLFYPLYVYVRTFKASPSTAAIGILFITLIFLISMNETAPFVKSNFVATYLLISLVLFNGHLQQIRRQLNG